MKMLYTLLFLLAWAGHTTQSVADNDMRAYDVATNIPLSAAPAEHPVNVECHEARVMSPYAGGSRRAPPGMWQINYCVSSGWTHQVFEKRRIEVDTRGWVEGLSVQAMNCYDPNISEPFYIKGKWYQDCQYTLAVHWHDKDEAS